MSARGSSRAARTRARSRAAGTTSVAATSTRRMQAPRSTPAFVLRAAHHFAAHVSLPQCTGSTQKGQMRDLKGWLATLVSKDHLQRWVQAAAALSFNLVNHRELEDRGILFTRAVLRIVLVRDQTKTQSIDTTLRRQCCTDHTKSGLTFMKILKAVCAAYHFAGSTTRCYAGPWRGVNAYNATKWLMRYDYLVACMQQVRNCVKNDSASRELIRHITDKQWGSTLAEELLKEHHSVCKTGPGAFMTKCMSMSTVCRTERDCLQYAVTKSVVDAAPHNNQAQLVFGFLSATPENDPLYCAALLVPFNPGLAISVVDRAIGLKAGSFKTGGMPIEIHRELHLFDRLRQLTPDENKLSQAMTTFSRVFKFNKPPLLWWPDPNEIELIINKAHQGNAVAITVWGLMFEHMAAIGQIGQDECGLFGKRKALGMYRKSQSLGDLFGATHAAKIYLEGAEGVDRDPVAAERLLRSAANQDVRVALSVLGDVYNGAGEPAIPKDEKEAAACYEKAADKGCLIAAKKLADMYETGRGGLVQDTQRAEMLRKTALEKEERKKKQKEHLAPPVPASPIPIPDSLIDTVDLTQSSSQTESQSPPSIYDEQRSFARRPVEVEIPQGNRRHRDDAVDETYFSLQENNASAEELMPVDFSTSWDCSVKRRRTNYFETLEIWR